MWPKVQTRFVCNILRSIREITYSYPPTYIVPQLHNLPPDTISKLNEARKFVRKMLQTALNYLTPMIRSLHFTVWLKFRSKAPLKQLRSLTVSLRRGPRWFRSWLRGLESLMSASRCLRTLIRTNSEQLQLDKELWGCLLAVRGFWRRRRGLCLARPLCFISSSHLPGTRVVQPVWVYIFSWSPPAFPF